MKLLIVTSMSPETSSTFIKAQIKHLQPDQILHSGFRPFLYDHRSIFTFPLSISFIRVFVKRVLPFLYSVFYTKALEKFLKKNKFQVVLCNFGPQGSNIAQACCRARVPLIVHFHGYDAYIISLLKKYRKRYSYMFGSGFKFVVVSGDMSKQLVLLGCPAAKIIENPYGFDTRLFSQDEPAKNNKQLIFVGRFTEKKAPDVLITAFNYALGHVPEARLMMIGHGKLYNKVVRQIHDLGIEKSVTLMGFRTQEVVIEEMQRSMVYVQHSITASNGDSEGSPVSIIEAAGCGLPVISTKHAGITKSVIHGKTGFLVDEGDWKTMGQYMIKLLNDPELAENMGKEGRQHILQNFNIETQIQKLRDVLMEGSQIN